MQATYQTRIEGNDEALSAYAALYGRVQRRLFAGGFFRQVRGIDEEGLRQGIRYTGPDVQRGAGIPGGEGLGGARSPNCCTPRP